MKKGFLILITLFLSQMLSAQLPAEIMRKGQNVLDDLMNSRGEKVYEKMNGELKAAITVPQLNSLWIGMIMQFGKCEKVTDWENKTMNGFEVITSRLHFEKQNLMFLISFYEGKINGLRVMPDTETLQAKNNEDFEERNIAVVTGKFKLPGFLTLPKNGSNFPCVVLVHGSGAHDRNETLAGNKPFEDLAHGLAKQGIATIRYDKRAFVYKAQSVPEGEELNLKNEVTQDALSAVGLACSQKEIDPHRVFILGHSLGGMLAPRIATLCPQLKGIVMMAGNARPLEVVVADQITYLNSLNPTLGWEEQLAQLSKQFENVKRAGTPQYDSTVGLPMGQPLSYWQDFNSYNQTEVAKTLTLPIFILNGEKDYQVTLTDFNLWKRELDGKKNVTFKAYPDLSHLFMQASDIPSPKDYQTPQHIPEYVINDLATWIKEQK